jgi:hypothetical protein
MEVNDMRTGLPLLSLLKRFQYLSCSTDPGMGRFVHEAPPEKAR